MDGNGRSNGTRPGAIVPPASPAEWDPEVLMFAAQLALHRGNAAAAARTLGKTPAWGRKMCERHSGLREFAKTVLTIGAEATVLRWQDLHARALQRINDLIDGAEDERVQLAAAQYAIERCEGRVPQKVEIDTTDRKR